MNIRNETEKVTIELFGDIGESWFEEGNTMESLNADIKAAIGKPIDLIVSSLGGSVDHALAMHDLLKMHKCTRNGKDNRGNGIERNNCSNGSKQSRNVGERLISGS